jgi:hypothetical protein
VNTVGIQISEGILRICRVDDEGALVSAQRVNLEVTLSPYDWAHPDERLVETITAHLTPGQEAVSLSLPGGFYQMRRVPLEVAEEVDRRSQVVWEVSQSLSSPEGAHTVEYVVRGSSAIWIATPNACIDALSSAFERRGMDLSNTCPAPIALVHALIKKQPVGQITGILSESGWVSRIDLENRKLVSATTTSPQGGDLEIKSPRQDILEATALKRAEEEPPQGETYLVGDTKDLDRMSDSIDHLDRLYPCGQNPGDNIDTLSTIAYGAALSATSEVSL